MDLEQTFLRVHARLSGILARLMTPRFRTALEYLCLFKALVLLSLLVLMHVNFVGQPGCVKELSKPGIAEAQLIQLKKTAVWDLVTSTPKDEHRGATWNKPNYVDVGQWERNIQFFDPTYLYSVEKGFLILSKDAKLRHNVQSVNINISAQSKCFGNRFQQFLINNFVGYDTVLMNSLLNVLGKGHMYNFQTKELYSLNYLQESRGVLVGLQDYIVLKFGVLIMSLFIFFTTTTSVSFTLRETHTRMLKFTVQLQHHARHHLPTYRLIFVHVFESLVFVPIMIGILFFLFEFFDDQLLAFMVLTLVWLCELFTMISMRTSISTLYFPLFCFLYFMVFHVYVISYPCGFSYLAFSTTAASMQHLILYFWNHFEVPALQHFSHQRALLQQGITSSSILTSALELHRVNQGSVVIMGGRSISAPPENNMPMQGASGTRTEESTVSQAQGGIVNRRSLPHNHLPLTAGDLNSRSSLNEMSTGIASSTIRVQPFGFSFLLP